MRTMALAAILWLSSGVVLGQGGYPEIKSVDIFKDGSAFFVHEGRLKVHDGRAVLSPVPDAAFGTLWIAATDGSPIEEILTLTNREVTRRTNRTMQEMLKANVGRRIIWNRNAESKPTLSGVLQDLVGAEDRMIAILKSGPQTYALPVSAYYDYIEFPDGFNAETSDTTEKKSLSIRTAGSKSEIPLQMVYFQSSFGWTPSYRIELLDDKKAQIVLAATVVNDAQDVAKASVNLVVGFPRFLYANVPTPLTLQQSWSEFMQSLYGYESDYSSRRYQSVMANQSMSYGLSEISAADYGGFTAKPGKAEEDLFFYSIPNFSLKKGERGQYNLFSAVVPYRHIFEVQLDNGLSSAGTNQNKEPYEVWHSIRLENTSKNPWTTGSAMTIQNTKPLGQDILKYTPIGSSIPVKITQAPDIQVTDEEKETARKEDARKKGGYYYDLVTIDGEITVANRKDKDITLTVTRPVTGRIVTVGTNAKVTTQATISSAVNPENLVVWEVPVKARGEVKIDYRYEAYLQR